LHLDLLARVQHTSSMSLESSTKPVSSFSAHKKEKGRVSMKSRGLLVTVPHELSGHQSQ
jgi:hypothetical protein